MSFRATPRPERSPFVGRDHALDHLAGALAAARLGRFAAVLVGGPSGIGKSRLVMEFCNRAARLDQQLSAAAHPDDGEVAPLEPIHQLLQGHAPAPDGVSDGTDVSGKEQLFHDIASTFGTLADRDPPLVLTVEDLHWADATTLEVLGFLARRLTDHPVLLLATFRDGHEVTPRLGRLLVALARNQQVTRLALEPLDPDHSRRLLAHQLGRGPDELELEAVIARSEGIPLFVEELGNALARDEEAVPRSLRELFLDTLRSLDVDAQTLADLAAVCGDAFSHQLVAEVSEHPADMLEQLTGALHEAGVLVPDARGTGYRFRHALLRETILDQLRPATRQRLHATCARALSSDPSLVPEGRSIAEELARHWREAGQAAPTFWALLSAAEEARSTRAYAEALRRELDAIALFDRLLPNERRGQTRRGLLSRAATSAGHIGDHEQESTLLDQALQATDELEARSQLHVELTRSRFLAGDRIGAARAASTALTDLPGDSHLGVRASLLALSASFRDDLQDPASVLLITQEALALARRSGDATALTTVLCCHGLALAEAGRDLDAATVLSEAERVSAGVEEPRTHLRPTVYRVLMLQRLGRDRDVLTLGHDAVARADHLGVASSVGQQLRVPLVDALIATGRFSEASEVIDDGLAWGSRGWPGAALTASRAELAMQRGHLAAAQAELDALTTIAGNLRSDPRASSAAAELAWLRGDADASRVHAAHGLRLTTGASGPDELGALVHRLTRATRAPGSHATRSDQVRAVDAVEVLTPPRNHPLLAAWHATASAELTTPGEAGAAAWDDAASCWRHLDRPPMLATAIWRSASHHLDVGAVDAARTRLLEADELASELGMTPLLVEVRGRLAAIGTIPAEQSKPETIDDSVPDLGLTPREVEVLTLVARGWSNKRIASELVVSPRTVSTHVSRLLRKLEVESRGQAAALAHRLRLAGP